MLGTGYPTSWGTFSWKLPYVDAVLCVCNRSVDDRHIFTLVWNTASNSWHHGNRFFSGFCDFRQSNAANVANTVTNLTIYRKISVIYHQAQSILALCNSRFVGCPASDTLCDGTLLSSLLMALTFMAEFVKGTMTFDIGKLRECTSIKSS